MTPEELYIMAKESGEYINLVKPKGLIKGFPRGELLCENHNGTTVRRYKSAAIIQWLIKNELVKDNHHDQ